MKDAALLSRHVLQAAPVQADELGNNVLGKGVLALLAERKCSMNGHWGERCSCSMLDDHLVQINKGHVPARRNVRSVRG
jgi:hypothetical protein